MTLVTFLTLGFLLGMRHATDSDHVVAVTTIVSRERSVRSASAIGAFWGIGHTVTIMVVGGAIIVFGLAFPARVTLSLELSVAFMLVVLGLANVLGVGRRPDAPAGKPHRHGFGAHPRLRSLAIGVVHGLAGSAAVALLVLATIKNPAWALVYLFLFGIGTVVGMMLITSAIAIPLAYAARQFSSWNRHIGRLTGMGSVALGLFLVYQIGFVDGLFAGAP
ncbi:MAG TPA: high-affinity nickel-transport family protein [Polyangiaceae bacterium]|nr:high-affinity nickel-transport family protein [Polyangiaceae bacterium]